MAKIEADCPSEGRAIEALYAAGSGEFGWDVALGEVAAFVGADIAAIFTERPASPEPFACLTNASREVQSVFATWDSIAKHQDAARAALDRVPPGTVRRIGELVSAADYRESGFFRDYAVQFDCTDYMGVDLDRRPHSVLNLCLYVQHGRVTFGEASERALIPLIPHIRRALRLDRLFARERLGRAFALAALDMVSTPVFAVDRRRAVLYANAAAEAFIAADGGLQLRHGILDAGSPQHPPLAMRLRRLMETAGEYPAVQTIAVSRAAAHPLVLTVFVPPRRSDFWAESGSSGGAIVFVGDPGRELADVGRDLQTIHGLTEREAEVAVSLANGRELSGIAWQAGVGIDTARKHLKQAFAKTGTSRQAELVRLVLLELGHRRNAVSGGNG